MHKLPRSLMWLILASILYLPADGAGVDGSTTEPAPTADMAEEIAGWIRQLDSNRFAERNAASQNLESAGRTAIPALADAAVGESREVTLRSLDILRKHFQVGDEATKAAARESLEKIAAGDHVSAARRAKDILDPPKPPAQIQGLAIGPQRIRIQFNAVAGNQTRQIQINNGVKQTEITDGARKIKIVEDPAGAIQIEVTEKKDGKPITKKFQAKNADDLKKNHPEGHKLYEKYGRQVGPIVRLNGIQVQAGGAPAIPAQPAARVGQTRKKLAAAQLRAARQLIESSSRQLQQQPADENGDQALGKTLERLKKITQQLEQEEAELNKTE